MSDSDITATDIFCGAGGSTTGAEQAGVRVKLALNHWDRAIETHNTNYPKTSHALTDYNNGEMSPIEDAAPTATTKARHALVTAEGNEQEIRVENCGFRMLDPEEIKRAMAFPDDYILLGNRREKVKLAGNAVTAPVMKELVKRVISSLSH